MVNLLKQKLEAVESLKCFTMEILSLSPITDDEKISIMVAERQNRMCDIDLINEKIDRYIKDCEQMYQETVEIRAVKDDIKKSLQEIINMDKEIRKLLNDELKRVKSKLNQPEVGSKLVNIKI